MEPPPLGANLCLNDGHALCRPRNRQAFGYKAQHPPGASLDRTASKEQRDVVTISLSPLTAAADHSNTGTPYPTAARSTAGEYGGFEYAGLPVKVCIFSIAQCYNMFRDPTCMASSSMRGNPLQWSLIR
jgi:hypothetical protein